MALLTVPPKVFIGKINQSKLTFLYHLDLGVYRIHAIVRDEVSAEWISANLKVIEQDAEDVLSADASIIKGQDFRIPDNVL